MLQLFEISKSYKTADFLQTALDGVSIAFRDNEFVAVLGPSGSGKTTLLNVIGGLDSSDSGNLVIDGIGTAKYKSRDWDTYRNNRIGFVFQSYNLIPHQSVLSNVELALTLSGVSRKERRQRAKDALAEVGLEDHIHKRPNQLSGGQMQRVAVARALINDPEILLADEPTGALDSTTSTQIMDLLTEIAKDRLVVMVTHNPELAEQYATRIIKLHDGHVTEDSDPYTPTPKEEEKLSVKKIRRAAMSFFTAILLSFNNLMTKKGRTVMTAFAGSIGIIGIASILALANGVNQYIKNVEEDTLSMYPLSIESTGFDMTAMMVSMMGTDTTAAASEAERSGTIQETMTLTDMLSRIEKNDLASLKKYLESGESGIEQYANMISYMYGIRPLIFNPDTSEGIWQVNPNKAFSALSGGGSLSGYARSAASMMTSGGNSNVFHQMLNNPDLLDAQYDVVAGRWPESYNEIILVLNNDYTVSDYTLYAMGLRDPLELDAIVNQIASNEIADTPDKPMEFTYSELMSVTFRLVNAADTYVFDEKFEVWQSKTDDLEFMEQLVTEGTELRIVGVVAPKPDASVFILSPGLGYTVAMQTHLINEASKTRIVQDQLSDPELNIFTGRTFVDEQENPDETFLDFSSLFSVDEGMISSAFSFNTGALSIDTSRFTDFDFSEISKITPPEFDIAAMLGKIDTGDIDQDKVDALITDFMNGFMTYFMDNYGPIPDPNEMPAALVDYMQTPEVQALLEEGLGEILEESKIESQIQEALQAYMQQTMQIYINAIMKSLTAQLTVAMTDAMTQLSNSLANAMSIDEDAIANAFKFEIDEKELEDFMLGFMSAEENSFEGNLRSLGFADFDNPTSISIYPKDFASKERIVEILDNYNRRMEAQGMEDRVILYTDLVGTLMSSVTSIVNMVSYVLVAFVAISLVVSSIMIGIITYISVLERRKEIGILRAIGARKKDISSVFNAETLIVGFVAGLIGVALTVALCIPANVIIYDNFQVPDLASLPWEAAGLLVVVSMFLSFIAGLIPASSASRKDPVEALRSE